MLRRKLLGPIVTVVLVLVPGIVGPAAASGKARHGGRRAPVVLVADAGEVAVGGSAGVWFKAPKGASCRLSASSAGKRSVSPRVRVRTGLLQYSWTVPFDARGGRWRLRLTCSRRGRTAGAATARLSVIRGGRRGTWPIPRRLQLTQPRLTTARGGRGAGAFPPFGTVLVAGGQWLDGQGVDVKSNGGIGCYARCEISSGYGIAYQCVELVQRLLVTKGWSTKIAGDAWKLYDNAPAAKFDKYANGSGYIPVPGDIIVWHGGVHKEGHVAVVEWVADGRIGWVEQNNSASGRSSAPLGAGGTLGSYGALIPTGFLHARANVRPAPPTTPVAQSPLQGSSPDLQGPQPNLQGSSPNLQGSSPDLQGGGGNGGGTPPPVQPPPTPPATKGFFVQDSFLGGTWARYDPNDGTWYSSGNRPSNGKYWFKNGLGVAVDCARSAAAYSLTINGQRQTWSWWAHVTDNTWVPTAVFSSVWTDGNPGVATC